MSSAIPTSALSRVRSLRKPSTKPDTTSASGEGKRNVSPSRLPVKGQVQTSTTAPTVTRTSRSVTTSAGTGTTKSSRPLSGVLTRITSSSSARQREKDSPGPQASPPSRLTRAPSTRQSSTSTRPATSGADLPSAARPTTSSGVPTSRRVASGASTGPKASHARAKSSVTTLSSATTLRPPSQTSSTSSSTTTATADRSRPPLSSLTRARPAAAPPGPTSPTVAGAAAAAAHRRRPSNPSTSPSTSTTTTSAAQAATPSSGASLKPKPKPQPQAQGGQPIIKPTSSSSTKLEPRPAFTTHQQHFSPAKSLAPKPLTSTFLVPPSPSKLPANIALSAETARLQTELLQLHLLHRDAGTTLEAWKCSARQKLQGKFEAVRRQEEEVCGLERRVAEEVNAAALREWGSIPGGSGSGLGVGLEERIALLDQIVTGLWSVVGEPGGGGRYERVVRKFEKWCGKVERVMLARRQQQEQQEQQPEGGEAPELEEVVFIEEMDAAWKEECAALVRRLDEWRRGLRELPDPIIETASSTTATAGGEEEGQKGYASSLGRILAGCRALVYGMLAELNLMEQIEREAAAEEMRWVREMNRRGLGGMDEGTPRAGAIWRVL
ncbi:hypothetical protein C8A03DRAFT_34653 [Achaetomium macrosporum]|uniref:Uncharacterized protein n=1 Tax=Achaetomium macrosporum TaxID=79813 RepID=A0AAN7H6I9_9PEZI|nr:hypothetical protein C8A03DRAFT_34653 [Achaetomium macrosporum]